MGAKPEQSSAFVLRSRSLRSSCNFAAARIHLRTIFVSAITLAPAPLWRRFHSGCTPFLRIFRSPTTPTIQHQIPFKLLFRSAPLPYRAAPVSLPLRSNASFDLVPLCYSSASSPTSLLAIIATASLLLCFVRYSALCFNLRKARFASRASQDHIQLRVRSALVSSIVSSIFPPTSYKYFCYIEPLDENLPKNAAW